MRKHSFIMQLLLMRSQRRVEKAASDVISPIAKSLFPVPLPPQAITAPARVPN